MLWNLFKQRVRSQHPETTLFLAEELHFLEYVPNYMNKSLSDTANQQREVVKTPTTFAARVADRRH